MKKNTLCSLGIIAVVLAAILLVRGRVIGTVKGAEMEQILVGDVIYQQNNDTGLSYRDKGRYLGRAVSGDITFRVYAVKGDSEERYLYRLWEWEGAFYEKQE